MTLKPGSWPPSPGLAPCATLISSSRHCVEVFGGDAEPARGHLLDRRVGVVAVGARRVARRVLAALAADSDLAPIRFMAIASVSCASGPKRAERHAGRDEALPDLGDRLDLVERDRAACSVEVEQVAQIEIGGSSRTAVGIAACRSGSCRWRPRAAAVDQLRLEGVGLAAAALAVEAADRQRRRRPRRRRARACAQHLHLRCRRGRCPRCASVMPGKNSATSVRDRPTASKL